ncbi:MAG: hypothetical protein ACFFAN_09135 [Promethearchaeota archaeon]
MKRFLLSHHPSCEEFDKHTIKIGKFRFCIGCYVGYPTAIIGIFTLWFLHLSNIFVFNSINFLIISMILLSSFILSPINLTKIRTVKIIQKFLIGFGSAFLFWWIWSLQYTFLINLLIFFMVFGVLLMGLNAYHAYGFHKICKKCDFSLDWENCPGFKALFECLKKNNLKNIFKIPKKLKIYD